MKADRYPRRRERFEGDQSSEDPGQPVPERRPQSAPLGERHEHDEERHGQQRRGLDDPPASGQSDAQALNEILPRRRDKCGQDQKRDSDPAHRPGDFHARTRPVDQYGHRP